MNEARLALVLSLIDGVNARDPNVEMTGEGARPRELLYGQRMSACLTRICPDPSELLQIAVRGQHIARWETPREGYPPTREGYLRWRTFLYGFHARTVARLMTEAGYDQPSIERVGFIIQKRGLKSDADVQLLEDVACLVFLEYYFLDFAKTQPAGKLVPIIRKTWKKMSGRAQELALQLPFPESVIPFLSEALGQG